jgi:hypothetical protein
MPIDFIDQLSKFEKSPIVPFVNCGRFRRLSEYLFRIKRLSFDGQNILMRQKQF